MAAYDYESNFLTIQRVAAQPVLFNLALDHVYADLSSIADSPQISALLISHLHGDLAPMAAIRDIADARGIPIIEDAAQAPGAIVDGKRAGAWGDIGILSFGGSKPLCAGRGGAILTSSPRLHQRIRLYLSRGVQQWGALSELQAIALLPQLETLDAANAHRWSHVQSLDAAVREILGITPLTTRVDDRPSFYKRGFWYDADAFGLSRERFVQAMRAEGIALDAGFRALHVGRSSRRFRAIGSLTHAERAHHEMVILHHPVLLGTASDVQEVADAIAKTYANADRLAC